MYCFVISLKGVVLQNVTLDYSTLHVQYPMWILAQDNAVQLFDLYYMNVICSFKVCTSQHYVFNCQFMVLVQDYYGATQICSVFV